jgi:hypothetical protein
MSRRCRYSATTTCVAISEGTTDGSSDGRALTVGLLDDVGVYVGDGEGGDDGYEDAVGNVLLVGKTEGRVDTVGGALGIVEDGSTVSVDEDVSFKDIVGISEATAGLSGVEGAFVMV